MKAIRHLILKDILLEWKQKYAINGILLYIISTIFLCSLAFEGLLEPNTWNALFWVVLLFAAVNAISKSFVQENPGRQVYYYSVARPQDIILAKIVYNILLMCVLSILFYIIFTLFLGNFVQNQVLFFLCFFIGSIGLASLFTMISAIASRTSNNFALMAILGFPIILPLLLLLIKISKTAIQQASWQGTGGLIVAMTGINLIIIVLSYLLFPYLWRE
ncbi:MAG: heme exporter protein CcmB [Bacteroidetes bacterium]|nr:heme exporter protein CcmB [Bacteroidota bacterium]